MWGKAREGTASRRWRSARAFQSVRSAQPVSLVPRTRPCCREEASSRRGERLRFTGLNAPPEAKVERSKTAPNSATIQGAQA